MSGLDVSILTSREHFPVDVLARPKTVAQHFFYGCCCCPGLQRSLEHRKIFTIQISLSSECKRWEADESLWWWATEEFSLAWLDSMSQGWCWCCVTISLPLYEEIAPLFGLFGLEGKEWTSQDTWVAFRSCSVFIAFGSSPEGNHIEKC